MGDYNILIVGKPNTGKSTLLNAIVGTERVITSPLPGTTRDYIEADIVLKGKNFRLIDTAGYRKVSDEIESRGIAFMFDKIKESDLVLLVVDAEAGIDNNDQELLNRIKELDREVWIIINKLDLRDGSDIKSTLKLQEGMKLFEVSALYGWGVEQLKERLSGYEPVEQNVEAMVPLTSQRHYEGIYNCVNYIEEAIISLNDNYPPEIIAQHLHDAARTLAKILGIEVEEGLLEHIFSNFCVGK